MQRMKVTVRRKPLLRILAERNMSQNGLGRITDLKSGHVSQIISGKRNVAPETRERILKALGDVAFDKIFSVRFAGRR
jgi:transcriptional regulator with XRE-family HTH domain